MSDQIPISNRIRVQKLPRYHRSFYNHSTNTARRRRIIHITIRPTRHIPLMNTNSINSVNHLDQVRFFKYFII